MCSAGQTRRYGPIALPIGALQRTSATGELLSGRFLGDRTSNKPVKLSHSVPLDHHRSIRVSFTPQTFRVIGFSMPERKIAPPMMAPTIRPPATQITRASQLSFATIE
jgi:hypothetical protein